MDGKLKISTLAKEPQRKLLHSPKDLNGHLMAIAKTKKTAATAIIYFNFSSTASEKYISTSSIQPHLDFLRPFVFLLPFTMSTNEKEIEPSSATATATDIDDEEVQIDKANPAPPKVSYTHEASSIFDSASILIGWNVDNR